MSIHTSPVSPIVDSFQLTEADKKLTVKAIDLPGAGGAYHVYEVSGLVHHPFFDGGDSCLQTIAFQQGPVENDTPNGITIEALLAICKHRLDCFQAGPYPSTYNERALVYIEQALAALQERTRARINSGVEGKMVADPSIPEELPESELDYLNSILEAENVCEVLDVLSSMDITYPLVLEDTFTRNAILSNVAAQFDLTEDQFPEAFMNEFDETVYQDATELSRKIGAMLVEVGTEF